MTAKKVTVQTVGDTNTFTEANVTIDDGTLVVETFKRPTRRIRYAPGRWSRCIEEGIS